MWLFAVVMIGVCGVQDLIWIAVGVGFLLVSLVYVALVGKA
jgi:hypothetical protein